MPAVEPRLKILLTIAAVIVLVTVAVGIYGLLHGPGHRAGGARAISGGSGFAPAGSSRAGGQAPAVLPRTDDPEVYARAVAAAIFDWTSTSGYSPADYTAPVLAGADSGEELPGLIEDLARYEPTGEDWKQLAAMQVAQHLTISRAAVPSLWRQALAQAHGRLRPGTTAITITGTRQRTGVFHGQDETTKSPVSFTIFEVCAPSYARCHTLRLSILNDPLS